MEHVSRTAGIILILILSSSSVAAIPDILEALCLFYDLLYYAGGAIAAIVIVYGGIKWMTSEGDTGARKAAKMFVVHAIVGLMIVIVAPLMLKTIFSITCVD